MQLTRAHRRAGTITFALAFALTAACHREKGAAGGGSMPAKSGIEVATLTGAARADSGADSAAKVPGVEPGIHPRYVYGAMHNPYVNDRAAAAAGRRLFVQYNCSGCHGGHAGGGMGPGLRDQYWVYGNSDVQLFSTIAEGRSEGMPAWGGRIPEDQVWQLISYIRTLNQPAEPEPPPRGAPEMRAGDGIGQPPALR